MSLTEMLITTEAVCSDKQPGDPEAKVVPCTSPQAAWQIAAKGAPIAAETAARLGVKTQPAELAPYTLLLDSHTIAVTPEDKAFAATLPQPGLDRSRAAQIHATAALSIAALGSEAAARSLAAQEEAKKADAGADKKLKATLEDKAAKPKSSGTKAEKAAAKKDAATAKKQAAADKKTAAAEAKAEKKRAADEKKAAKASS